MLLKTVSFSLCFWFSLIFFPDNDKQAHPSLSTEHPIISTNVHPLHFHLKLDSVPALLVLIQLCDCRCNWCQGLLKPSSCGQSHHMDQLLHSCPLVDLLPWRLAVLCWGPWCPLLYLLSLGNLELNVTQANCFWLYYFKANML